MNIQDYLREVKDRIEKAMNIRPPPFPTLSEHQEIADDLATLAEICETLMGALDKICSKGSLLYKGNIVESNTQCLQDIARQAKVRVEEILEGKK